MKLILTLSCQTYKITSFLPDKQPDLNWLSDWTIWCDSHSDWLVFEDVISDEIRDKYNKGYLPGVFNK